MYVCKCTDGPAYHYQVITYYVHFMKHVVFVVVCVALLEKDRGYFLVANVDRRGEGAVAVRRRRPSRPVSAHTLVGVDVFYLNLRGILYKENIYEY